MPNTVLFGLRQILRQVLKISGFNQPSPDTCFLLANHIRKQTGRQISETTLKRLFGFAVYNFSTSPYTLDTLACFVGFGTWRQWQDHLRAQDSAMQCRAREQLDFSKLFYYGLEAMWVFETDGMRFLEVNDAACKIYGYTREQFLAMTVLDIRPIEDFELLTRTVQQAGECAHHSPSRHILSNGIIILADVRSYAFCWLGLPARLVTAVPFAGQVRIASKL